MFFRRVWAIIQTEINLKKQNISKRTPSHATKKNCQHILEYINYEELNCEKISRFTHISKPFLDAALPIAGVTYFNDRWVMT
jgi:hypothetical protein